MADGEHCGCRGTPAVAHMVIAQCRRSWTVKSLYKSIRDLKSLVESSLSALFHPSTYAAIIFSLSQWNAIEKRLHRSFSIAPSALVGSLLVIESQPPIQIGL